MDCEMSSAVAPTTTPQSTKSMTLKSKIEPEFSIKIGASVINCCSILRNVEAHTDNSEAVELDMTPEQLQQFVQLHEHFSEEDPVTKKDMEWTNEFFSKFSDADFKDLCWKSDYLDSRRFLEAAGDFMMHKFASMEVPAISEFLNIVDDYTPEERKTMEANPLDFFTQASTIKDGDDEQQAQPAGQ